MSRPDERRSPAGLLRIGGWIDCGGVAAEIVAFRQGDCAAVVTARTVDRDYVRMTGVFAAGGWRFAPAAGSAS